MHIFYGHWARCYPRLSVTATSSSARLLEQCWGSCTQPLPYFLGLGRCAARLQGVRKPREGLQADEVKQHRARRRVV